MEIKKNHESHIKEIGNKIKHYRISMNMTQQEMADASGVSLRSISRLEQGASVQLESLIKILIALRLEKNIEALVPYRMNCTNVGNINTSAGSVENSKENNIDSSAENGEETHEQEKRVFKEFHSERVDKIRKRVRKLESKASKRIESGIKKIKKVTKKD